MSCTHARKLYETASRARREAKRYKSQSRAVGKLRPIYCEACRGWHLTTSKETNRE